MKVAIDVQHLYRPRWSPKWRDQGTIYTLPSGAHVSEAHCTVIYAAALHAVLLTLGAEVLVNDPVRGILTGYYSHRNADANGWGADLYLACHLNAGGGSYAALEMMAGKRDDRLTGFIGNELVKSEPAILEYRTVSLARGDRGAVCIQGCAMPAVILEPFFGDNPRQQPLMMAGRLVEVGQALGRGIWSWWRSTHPIA